MIDFTSLAIGLALGPASKFIVKAYQKYRQPVIDGLKNIDNSIEEKANIDIPDDWQEKYERIVDSGVAFADRYAMNPAFWRNVIRAIMAKDVSKIDILLDEIKNIDWSKYIYDQMSEDLKEVVNTEKKAVAVSIVANRVAAVDAVKKGDMNLAVVHAAKADKSEKIRDDKPVTKEDIERMIEESKARQELLRK